MLVIAHKKIRADQLLVHQGLAPTRTKAQNLVMSGAVFCGTQKIEKPSQLFWPETELILKGKDHPYVSRGGVKLKGAIDHFKIAVKDKVCLDVGASTGGFTDCLLKEGAKKVYAVDVGYGQLDWSLRNDPRVVVIERTNFRNFDPNILSDPIDLVTVDVSFISLTKIIPKILEVFVFQERVMSAGGSRTSRSRAPSRRGREREDPQTAGPVPEVIALIKPQFEVGKKFVGKGGIVKDKAKQKECVEKISEFFRERGLKILGALPSPILGQDGNQEFLLIATLSH
ncbi:MAG: TlyA family RNA methyltransferase [Deltaproteobacteria bacterium]|nr:TlyA family RNA methyltransferase [Deltaproteobacteria bacterium]